MSGSLGGVATLSVPVAALGAALVGGIFYAFSSFVMRALGRVPPARGIAAMQSINVTVLTPSFLRLFMGTAALSLVTALLALTRWGAPQAPYLLAGAFLYLVGTFAVTAFGNVPLNERLAAVSALDPEAVALWQHYLERWTMLNTVRTGAAALASVLFMIGSLLQGS